MRILLFLKAPRQGTVKTRLAKTLGKKSAQNIYRQLVEHQLASLPGDADLEIHFAPADAENEFKTWLGPDRLYIPQCEGDLGDRLSWAVHNAFNQGAGRVACIGADCPGLTADQFHEAENHLQSADVVVGPTIDGGYYLIAMNTYHPELFLDIPWSTSRTLEITLDKAERAHLRVHTLKTLEDVDHESDWVRLRSLINLPPQSRPRP